MARVSGWYKRLSQKTVFLCGLIVAVGFNADTIVVLRALSQGTPFWFDLLNQVVNIRAAGPPPTPTKKASA